MGKNKQKKKRGSGRKPADKSSAKPAPGPVNSSEYSWFPLLNSISSRVNSKVGFIVTASFIILTALLEIAAYLFGGIFSVIASRIWLFEGILLFVFFLFRSAVDVVNDIKTKKYLVLSCFLVLLLLLGFCVGNIRISDVSPEACLQLSSGLNSFKETDWHYTGTGFVGYPNRQYLVAALPSIVLGRSVLSLHLGFGLLFLIGVVSLFGELKKWCTEHYKLPEMYALLHVGALVVFPFITEYYRNFEQAITPVALALIVLSLYMKLVRKPSVMTVLAITWTGGFLADSYTPGLAAMGLLIVFLVMNLIGYWKKSVAGSVESSKNKAILYANISSVVNMVMFLAATLIIGRKDRINATAGIEENLAGEFIKSIDEFLNERYVRFLGFFAGIFVIYLLFSLLGQLKIYNFIVSVWMICVVFIAFHLDGYTQYEKYHMAQRFMVIIPVFIVALFHSLMGLIKKKGITVSTKSLVILYAFSILCGVYNLNQRHFSFNYFGSVIPMKHLIVIVENELKANNMTCEDEFNLVVYTDSGLQTNIGDYAKYFFPNAKNETHMTEENADLPVFENDYPTIYVSDVPYPGGTVTGADKLQTVSYHDHIYYIDFEWNILTRNFT